MFTLVIFALILTCPFVIYHFVSHGESWNDLRSIGAEICISIAGSLLIGMLLVAFLVPISYLSVDGEPETEAIYESQHIGIESTRKTLKLTMDDGKALSIGKDAFTVYTTSDDPDIQSAIDQGKTVIEIEARTSTLTLLVDKTMNIYGNTQSLSPLIGIVAAGGDGYE